MSNRTRKIVMRCPVTDEERLQILLNKEKSKMNSISAYMRKMALDGCIVTVDLSIIKKYTAEINRLGNNLNQIAKRMNSSENINKNDVEEAKIISKKIIELERQVLKEFLKILKKAY